MRLYGTSTGDGVIRISPVQNYRKKIMIKKVKLKRKEVFETADKLYWLFLDSLEDHVANEYIENDPDVEMSEEIFAGTRNTEKGKALFFSIEGILEEL